MSFLPYDRMKPGQWALPFTGSLLFHGAALLLLSTASLAIIPPKEDEPELVISLEILDLENYVDTAPIAEIPDDIASEEEAETNLDGALEEAAEPAPTGEDETSVSEPDIVKEDTGENETVEEPAEENIAEPDPRPLPVAPEISEPQEGLALPAEQSLVQDNFVSPLAEAGGYAPSPFSGDISLETPDSLFTQPPLPDSPLDLAALEPPSVPETEEEADPTTPQTGPTGLGAPLANASAADLTIGQLLTRIRANETPRCTLALPRRGADGQVGLSLIGADRNALDTYSATILEGFETVTRVREEIDPRQCAALDAVALTASYPAARIGLSLASTNLQSGDTIEAQVSGAGGLDIAVLMIDDNGVVQDLSRFTTIANGIPVISAPVARVGSGRETRQILMVLGSEDGPFGLTEMDGRSAEDVFSALDRDRLEQSRFALVSFDLR
ncbi:ICP22 family protein [Celeribacter naphthalenivorans]|uniref:hypothetical protein n=1 Tax=Celeribacter naphthalenivorans TaxID=1614694 RepID=UPI001CFBDCD2|nr:hypothetical protein [Celeribacter naphthalenivorans]